MTSKYSVFLILYILLQEQISNCANNNSVIKNITGLCNLPKNNKTVNHAKVDSIANNDTLTDVTKTDFSKHFITKYLPTEVGKIANLYNFANDANTDIKKIEDKLGKEISSANKAELYNFSVTAKDNKNHKILNNKQMISKAPQDSNKSGITNLYDFLAENDLYKQPHGQETHLNNSKTLLPAVGSIAELYLFSSRTVMGLYNCSYENTINITGYSALPNGSYYYHNNTIIPPDLVGTYDYEVLYNGTKRLVPLHKRACICRLKACITLCSQSIIDFYQNVVNDQDIDDDFMNLFSIKITLTNKTTITRNIAKDFEHIILEEFCEPFYTLSPEKNEKLGWTLYENGTLLRHSDQVQLKHTEYCFELYQDEIKNQTYYLINPLNCAKKRDDLKLIQKFNYWTQVLSIPFFLLTIIAYFCLPELRNVHGKCFMTYLSCPTVSYSLISYINLSRNTFEPMPCLLMGYLNHYMQLSQYTWLGIICIDNWKSFSDYAYKATYNKYAMYGYHLPLLMTFLTFVAQNSKIDETLKPGINEHRCGLEVNKWAACIYLYGPCSIILVCCLISFILTSKIIKTNNREVYKINELHLECPRVRYTLYLRLFLMMGLSWFLDIISYFLNMFKMQNFSEQIDYINALQGLYVFVNFIGRRRVRYIIRERFCERSI